MKPRRFSQFAAFTALLALAVIMLGAYVRLSDAGLGCPDWPGCYGRLGAPTSEHAIQQANNAFPQRPVETHKAWKEMAHRYLAGALGLCILGLFLFAWRHRARRELPLALPGVLLALVIFQALLGMWTVTLLVNPSIVTAHLLGGMATFALLAWLALRGSGASAPGAVSSTQGLRPWVAIALLLLIAQISLGGWTSTNYAALACSEFPRCYGGQWWPPADFKQGFTIWRELGLNHEFGRLDSAARTAIHLTHRLGALIVFVYLGLLALRFIRIDNAALRTAGIFLLLALLLQVGLGVANVLGQLPLGIAVAHNGGAALLLFCLINALHVLSPQSSAAARASTTAHTGERT
jgi:cytochrome c oxidase assembly protein subunit 15